MRVLLLLLLLVAPAWAWPPSRAMPLDVKGDTITFVRAFPATITAPAGADFYFWSFPEGVKATAADHALTVSAAPQGTHRITVTAITYKIDFDKKTKEIIKDTGEVEINVGAGPKPPEPPAPTGLVKALRDARDASAGTPAERAEQMAKLAALYRQAPALLDRVKTAGELQAALLEARKLLLPETALVPVRKLIGYELANVLPGKAADPYGDPARVKALFSSIEAALVEANK
jgi:hypothetical protein